MLILIVGVSTVDMETYFKKYLVTAPVKSVVRFPADFIRSFLRGDERLLATSEIPQLSVSIPEKIPTVGGYDPFQVGCYVEAFRKAGVLPKDTIPDSWSPPPSWAARLGVGVVLSTRPLLKYPGIKPVAKYVYRVKDPAPLVEFKGKETHSSWHLVSDWQGQSLTLRGAFSTDGVLIIRQTFVPGWVARTKEGTEIQARKYEPFWQQFPGSKGEADLVLTYEPRSWRIGIRLFLVGLIGVLGLGFRLILTKFRPPEFDSTRPSTRPGAGLPVS